MRLTLTDESLAALRDGPFHPLQGAICSLVTEVLESRALLVAKDARIAELEEALRELNYASVNFHISVDAHLSEDDYENDYGLAVTESTLATVAWPRANRALGLPRIIGEDKT